MDDTADHRAIVDPRLPARIRRQMRNDPRELLFRQPKVIPRARRLAG
jgi:hypothetical protein